MPASSAFGFTDPHRYQAAIRASNIELFSTAKGGFNAELTQIDLDRLWMSRGSESLPTISHGKITARRVVQEFLDGGEQPAIQHNGIEVSPGEIVINDGRLVHRRCLSAVEMQWGELVLHGDGERIHQRSGEGLLTSPQLTLHDRALSCYYVIREDRRTHIEPRDLGNHSSNGGQACA